MIYSKTLALVGAVALFSSNLAGAADLKSVALTRSFERPDYTVSANPRPAKPAVILEHGCASEGYTCASGYSCEFIMSRNFEDLYGNPVDLNYGRTNNRYYSCNQVSSRTGPTTCSHGLTPSGKFYSDIQGDLRPLGGVPEYHCQQAL